MLNRFSPSQLCDSIDCSLPVSLSMGFSRKEYWSGLPCPPLGDLPDPGIEPASPMTPALQVDSWLLSQQGSPCYLQHMILLPKSFTVFPPKICVFWCLSWYFLNLLLRTGMEDFEFNSNKYNRLILPYNFYFWFCHPLYFF